MQALAEMAPIENNSLADLVVERIRRAIVQGQLKPGERLSEPALGAMLGVSRSPVREALQRLQIEGLVVGQTNRSCTVWEPTPQDVEEIISLRVMIESLAAERCVDQLTEDDFAELERLIAVQQADIARSDIVTLSRDDILFHEYLCRRANHHRLMDWWRQIMGQWEVLIYRRLMSDPEGIVPSVISDHTHLLEALRARDKDRVVGLHREINARVLETTVSVLNR